MENFQSFLMKVTPKENLDLGCYMAYPFEEFCLQMLRPDINCFVKTLGNWKFTDVYFRTKSSNIYRIYNDESLPNIKNDWILINIHSPGFVYYFNYNEMCYGRVQIHRSFHFGNYYLTTEVLEIVCVNNKRRYKNIQNAPNATLVEEFEGQLVLKND